MTMVGTPPPLPVRGKEGGQGRTQGALSPMLSRLADERATGVLIREHGTLHLSDGHVVHAESRLAPGLDLLLTAHGPLGTADWQQAGRRTDSLPGAARLLLDAGRLTTGVLELCHLGALFDAGYFALAPSSTPGRFRYGIAPGPAPLRPVPVTALERETVRRRELLHRIWPDPATDSAPLIRADPVAAPPVTSRQRAVLELVDGVRAAPDIARELGRRTFQTLVDVRRLAAAGLVAPGTAPGPSPPPLPQVTDPDIALLKRLRDALEAL
ncbi:transcriptional regulator [Streptomyces olivochromogenes]|uniref:transcriptional regulator n=1 Tax=Streptomyces olivochromogenes TaxID=1963 RepID=UPI001F438CCC|nr:transcriptional regulator [Streptomyces olivochromogenes]MCF3134300.1 transcriptional regulator [Streptomyces olivochromogenes]